MPSRSPESCFLLVGDQLYVHPRLGFCSHFSGPMYTGRSILAGSNGSQMRGGGAWGGCFVESCANRRQQHRHSIVDRVLKAALRLASRSSSISTEPSSSSDGAAPRSSSTGSTGRAPVSSVSSMAVGGPSVARALEDVDPWLPGASQKICVVYGLAHGHDVSQWHHWLPCAFRRREALLPPRGPPCVLSIRG